MASSTARLSASRYATATAKGAPASARRLVIRSFKDESKAAVPAPSWLPAEAKPIVDFFVAEDVKFESVAAPLLQSEAYTKFLKPYTESPVAKQATGWQQLPETINGRAAMIGFLAGASAEILGAGSLLQQAAALPQAVLLTLGLITAGSIIPVVKATEGKNLESLRDTYSIPPEAQFTEVNERLHGRVAMAGFTALLLIELLTGRALL